MTSEQIEYLKTIVKGKSVAEIAKLINEKFNTNFSINHIAYMKAKHNIYSGKLRTFEKGQTNYKHKPIGHEKINSGHVYIKVAEPSKYIPKQRYVWEKAYGKIPEGHIIIFADRNRRNFDLNNLMLVSKSEFLIMNDNHLYYQEPELTKSGVLVAKIIEKTRKYERRKK